MVRSLKACPGGKSAPPEGQAHLGQFVHRVARKLRFERVVFSCRLSGRLWGR